MTVGDVDGWLASRERSQLQRAGRSKSKGYRMRDASIKVDKMKVPRLSDADVRMVM